MTDGDLWRDRNKVFIAGLPLHVDDDALYEKCKVFGDMHQSKVVYDPKTGRSRGFGFVTFSDYTNALDAVDQLNQSKWEKRTLNVRFLQPKTGSNPVGKDAIYSANRPTKVIGPRPEGCTTIYVGNLAYDITEEVLRKVFDHCGSIRAVRFAEHIQTKEFRGFGYVQFHDEESCEAAVKLDGRVVMGRPMNIDYGARDEGYAQAREELQKKLKKGICHKFQQGQCTRGDACKFAHVLQDQDAEELVQPADRPISGGFVPGASLGVAEFTLKPVSDAPICINFQKGKCNRGNSCKFQHLQATEANVAPDENETVPNAIGKEKLANHEEETLADANAPFCQNFQKGKCKRGGACRFRHVAAPIDESWKTPVRVALPLAAVAKVAVCKNFQRGACTRGTSCRFAHTGYTPQVAPVTAVEEVSEYQKRFQSVCYNWQRTGSCQRGENCLFQHDKLPATQMKEEGQVKSDTNENESKKKEKKAKKEKKRKLIHHDEVDRDENAAKKHRKHTQKHKKEKKRPGKSE
ncbi:hypothetical protein CCR75_006341 [Bremia lactucae]|uniref:Uncharacterized protein n=1 Tax=Bremia lactucae TaxID=4779 RepID=A0A976FQB7_BRELC|nr:hypothetical protein CCR75_006341 [Bremia lactucae]